MGGRRGGGGDEETCDYVARSKVSGGCSGGGDAVSLNVVLRWAAVMWC